MNGILVVSYYFADMLGGAVRTNKFLKYWMRRMGCPVRVITAEKPGAACDRHLLEELHGDLKVARTPWIDYMAWQQRTRQRFARRLPAGLRYETAGTEAGAGASPPIHASVPHGFLRGFFRRLSDFAAVPDACWGWIPFAVYRGLRWAREYEVIYSTSPPESGHLIALCLKRLTGKPWVADFRDPWVGNAFRPLRSEALQRWNARWEAKVIRAADRVLCNTDMLREDLLGRYPGVDPAKFVTVWNGFDEEDFTGLRPTERQDGRLLILHTGSFYGLRTPAPFLKALGLLKEQGLISPQEVTVEFIGACSSSIARAMQEVIERYHLQSLVKISPPLPYRETLARQMSADILLLVGHHSEGKSMQIPGKAFEYIRAGKPILYLFPDVSATARLFEPMHGERVRRADPSDSLSIAVALRDLLSGLAAGPLKAPDSSCDSWCRRHQADRVLNILQDLAHAHAHPLVNVRSTLDSGR